MLCLFNVVLVVSAQLMLRHSTGGMEITSVSNLVRLAISPLVLLALLIYGASFIFWLYILARMPLSFAYPIQALAFPLVVFLSMLLFQETIPINRWVGVSIIIIGTVIASA